MLIVKYKNILNTIKILIWQSLVKFKNLNINIKIIILDKKINQPLN